MKKGFLSMLVMILSFTFFSTSMLSSVILGTSLTIQDILIAVLVGSFILCLYVGLLAYIANDTGLPLGLLGCYSFGQKGSYLVSFLLGITQVAWFGLAIAMFAVLLGKMTGMQVPILVAVSGLFITAIAYFGMVIRCSRRLFPAGDCTGKFTYYSNYSLCEWDKNG